MNVDEINRSADMRTPLGQLSVRMLRSPSGHASALVLLDDGKGGGPRPVHALDYDEARSAWQGGVLDALYGKHPMLMRLVHELYQRRDYERALERERQKERYSRELELETGRVFRRDSDGARSAMARLLGIRARPQ